ncbi:MAG: hypothetical protein P1U54_09115 [Immundisolibacteraceae bacterium]|nr:hypothetical protein [Immundisolibacteraceae bacterium]
MVCIQTDVSLDRPDKNVPIQSIVERQIQVAAYQYVDEVVVYNSEKDVLEIVASMEWDLRFLGDEYREKPFTGRNETLDRCYFNMRLPIF